MGSGLDLATDCTVLVPVLDRPHRVEPLLRSLQLSGADARITFITSPGDSAEEAEVRGAIHAGHWQLCYPHPPGPGDWAKKINYALRLAHEPGGVIGSLDSTWFLFAADDVAFHPGWLQAALAVYEETNACVVGTNDLHNREVMHGIFSCHPLVHRDYFHCGTIDEPGKVLHEGYDHNYPDREIAATARKRGTWAYAAESHVEHLHWKWQLADNDGTYKKGERHFPRDMRLFRQRERLWR